MRIFYSANGSDPMIAGTKEELNLIGKRIIQFANSKNSLLYLQADMSGSAAPYAYFLSGIELEKIEESDEITINFALSDIRVTGSSEKLRSWAKHFDFPEHADDGYHNHSYEGKVALIIEILNPDDVQENTD